ncbi:MAG TPA: hypothetical protein VEX18_02685 [Polyangiaceae bacterium]|nr:hypothetical protein [Polyangiaceae bacterium]
MKQYLVPATLAGALALTASVAGQTTPPASTSSQQTPAASAGPVTVEGCLMREDDVPGKKPNVVEKVGVGEDYILTSTKMVKGSAPAGAAAPSSGAVGTSGTTGTTGAMYDINGIDDDTLKRHVNRRVQVDGSFKSLDGGMKGDALIEIQATGIRPVSGDCPPK